MYPECKLAPPIARLLSCTAQCRCPLSPTWSKTRGTQHKPPIACQHSRRDGHGRRDAVPPASTLHSWVTHSKYVRTPVPVQEAPHYGIGGGNPAQTSSWAIPRQSLGCCRHPRDGAGHCLSCPGYAVALPLPMPLPFPIVVPNMKAWVYRVIEVRPFVGLSL